MTAINAVIGDDGSVSVFTDAAACRGDGTLDRLQHKAMLLPAANAVIALRGPRGMLPFVGNALERDDSFDEIQAGLLAACRRVFDRTTLSYLSAIVPPLGRLTRSLLKFDVLLAGISESRGPCIFIMSSVERPGVPAWTMIPTNWAAMLPACSIASEIRSSTDMIARMPDIMQDQRSQTEEWFSRHSAARVGGFIQHTEVRRDGIATRIIARWPDKIGERINPDLSPTLGGFGGH